MPSPLGPLTLVASAEGLAAIDFASCSERAELPLLVEAERQLSAYFAGELQVFDLPLDISRGTAFQQRVWLSLASIPFGSCLSYKEQAASLGMDRGFRAVGAANGKNPLPIVLPCHRVIASDGALHGYSGGLGIKRQLLALEGFSIRNERVEAASRLPLAT